MENGYYKTPIEKIIGDVISAMTFPVVIYKVTVAGSTYTLNVDDLYHAQVGKQCIVTIGGQPYEVTGVTYKTTPDTCDVLTVKDSGSSGPITATSFNMYPPFYFYGTLNETGAELGQISKSSMKTPMIFFRLDDSLEETFHADPQNAKERDSNAQVFCLAENDYSKVTSAMIAQGVNPMRRLFENFIEQVEATVSVFEKWDFDYKLKYYSKVFVRDSSRQLWSDQLSGVGASIPLKILRSNNAC